MKRETLTFRRVVQDQTRRSFRDERRKVRFVVVEYSGDDGEVYRKAFEGRPCEPIVCPLRASHDGLADVKHQWDGRSRTMLCYTHNKTV